MLARKTFLHFLNTLVGAVLGVVALKLVALYMGDALLGNVAFALGLLGLLQGVLKFSFSRAHEKRISEGVDAGDRLGTFLYIYAGLSLLFAVAAFGVVVFRVAVQGQGFQTTTLLTFVIVAVHFVLQNVRQIAVTTFNGRREIARSQTVTFVDDVFRIGGTIVAAVVYAAVVKAKGPLAGLAGPEWAWVGQFGPEILAGTYLLGSAAASLIGFYYLVRACPIGGFSREALGSYWEFARPLALVAVFSTIVGNLDRAMLGYFWTGSEVGVYFGADRIVRFLKSISMALGTVLMPAISHMVVEGDEAAVADVTHRSHRYTTMVLLPFVLFIGVFARPIIHLLLADSFLRGAPTLITLGIYTLFFVAYKPYLAVVQGMDRPDLSAIILGLVVATNLVLNTLLIPADIESLGIDLAGLGAFGAALATLAAGLVGYVGYRGVVGRMVDLRPQWPGLLRQLVAGVVMVGALYVLNEQVVGLARWFHLAAFGFLGLMIYVSVMHVLGEFTEEDLEFFLDTIHPGELWDYVRSELFDLDDEDDED